MRPGPGRDAYGIPHVVAGSAAEVARLQGRATGADRAWQLEWARRRAAGTTAALVGDRGLSWDLLARRFGLDALGRRAYSALAPDSRAFLDAHVAGLNEGLAGCGEVAELTALEAPAPQPWRPWTPLAVFAAHHLLFATFPAKLRRRDVHARLDGELARLLHHEGLHSSGSNAWAVGGDRTASGLPLVGGDPHRAFESPNTYQQVRLTCTDADDPFDVVGFTFPGVPGVQHFAHAGAVAWGITNAMADYQDLFLETLARDGDQVLARSGDDWVRVQRHVELVEVRDADPVEVEVLVTRNGPVVLGGPDGEVALSLRTPAWVLGDLGFGALLPLLRARSSGDVERALAGWVEPVNNLVVADVHGDVRRQVVGRVPLRPEQNRWMPVPGDDAHSWTGWVDPLPGRQVPADGQVVTANHRLDDELDVIGVEFAPPWRAERIASLLGERTGLRTDDFAAIHRDTLSPQPSPLLDGLRGLHGLSPVAEGLRADLLSWDGQMAAESACAAAYVALRDALIARLASHPPFSALSEGPGAHAADRYGAVLAPWFSVQADLFLSLPNLLGPRGRALLPALDDHVRAALEEVATAEPGCWGERHRFRPLHALGHDLPEEPPLDGDNECVRCTGAEPGEPTAFRGSVARYVWDLAGFATSGWVVPLGASGDPGSSHHHDQLAAWVEGRLLPVDGCAGSDHG